MHRASARASDASRGASAESPPAASAAVAPPSPRFPPLRPRARHARRYDTRTLQQRVRNATIGDAELSEAARAAQRVRRGDERGRLGRDREARRGFVSPRRARCAARAQSRRLSQFHQRRRRAACDTCRAGGTGGTPRRLRVRERAPRLSGCAVAGCSGAEPASRSASVSSPTLKQPPAPRSTTPPISALRSHAARVARSLRATSTSSACRLPRA